MELDLNKYEPINSKDKVDKLIEDISAYKVNFELIKTEILIRIRKVKIQIYFLECIDKVIMDKKGEAIMLVYKEKQTKSIQRKIKKEKSITKYISKAEKKDYPELQYFSNMNIFEISQFLLISKRTVLSVFRKNLNNVEISLDYIPSKNDLAACADFLTRRYNLISKNNVRQQILENDIQNFSTRRMIYLNESQKSYGKEGNYRKLIYIRTKT